MQHQPLAPLILNDSQGLQYQISHHPLPYSAIQFQSPNCAHKLVNNLHIPLYLLIALQDKTHQSAVPMGVTDHHNCGIFRHSQRPRTQLKQIHTASISHFQDFCLQQSLGQQLYKRELFIYSQQQITLQTRLKKKNLGKLPKYKLELAIEGQKTSTSTVTFRSPENALQFIESLRQPDDYWQEVASSQQTADTNKHNNDNDAKKQVAALLAEKKLWLQEDAKVETNMQYASAPPKTKSNSTPPSAPKSAASSNSRNTPKPKNNVQAQIETLKQAAASGAPFCEECAQKQAA